MKSFTQLTHIVIPLLLVTGLVNLLVNTDNAVAQTNRCRQIRQVRRLAIGENLDGRNLQILERYYCDGNRSNQGNKFNNSEECQHTRYMTRLANISGSDRSLLQNLLSLENIVCYGSLDNRPLYYPNGNRAKFGASLYYPNGNRAKFGSSWYYPNGNKARFGSFWYYPNGQIMRK